MAQVQRKVSLISHTQLAKEFKLGLLDGPTLELFHNVNNTEDFNELSDAMALALTAIRTCYSPGKPSEIVKNEALRYLKKKAKDGGQGTDADRLIRMIHSSGHTSTLEHISFNFAVEGVSRALLAQLTRHRIGTGFSVQSQRYVKFGSDDRSGGFDYVIPDTVSDNEVPNYYHGVWDEDSRDFPEYVNYKAIEVLDCHMQQVQITYDRLRRAGVPAEDARAVLPNAAACNLVLTFNLRAFLDFYGKRQFGNGAQAEIAGLAEDLKREIVKVEPWTTQLFGEASL